MCDGRAQGHHGASWISCREVVGHLLDYTDGTMDEPARRSMELHLKMCPPCRDFLSQYRSVPFLAGKALNQSDRDSCGIPPDVAGRLMSFLESRMGEVAPQAENGADGN